MPAALPKAEHTLMYVGGLAVLILVAASLYLLFGPKVTLEPSMVTTGAQSPQKTNAVPAPADGSLGGELYQSASDPLGGKLPEATDATANPIDEAYKNPFQ
jgi:hypothetical protein